jgi:hypothetical protein
MYGVPCFRWGKLVDLTTRWVGNFVNEHLKTVLNIMMIHRPWIGALDPRVLSRKKYTNTCIVHVHD